jgi:hypothetical protein
LAGEENILYLIRGAAARIIAFAAYPKGAI